LAGLPTPRPYGVVELTPEREYLLVTEFFDGAVELGEADVDDHVIHEGLQIIRKLWAAGLAHRDIKPANLLVRNRHLLLIDVFFSEVRPTPWRQAVDLANMMLCLALRSSPERVYQRALRQFSVAEISEGFAAARGFALPSQLRRMLREQGRDLHAEFSALLPTKPRPIRIQRWSAAGSPLMVPGGNTAGPHRAAGAVQRRPEHHTAGDQSFGLPTARNAVVTGPIGSISVPGALRATTARLDGGRPQREKRLVRIHSQPRPRR
jgi:tRNA A-37 threonylcarbamoyl transferase component Bud32